MSIAKEIIAGGLDNIQTQYLDVITYSGAGIISSRRRVGGLAEFGIRDEIINLGLANEYHRDREPVVEDSAEVTVSEKQSEILNIDVIPIDSANVSSDTAVDENFSPFLKMAGERGSKKATRAKFIKAKTNKIASLTVKDIQLCKEIGDMFDIDFNGLKEENLNSSTTVDCITGKNCENASSEILYVLKVLKRLYIKSDSDFIKDAVEKFGLKQIVCDALRVVHESIVTQYLYISKMYMEEYPNAAYISDDTVSYPLNYSDNLISFKHIIFKNKHIQRKLDHIQGFCAFEPTIRVFQLLSFPIEQMSSKLSTHTFDLGPITSLNLDISDLSTGNSLIQSIVEDVSDDKPLIEQIQLYSKKIIERQQHLQKQITNFEQHYIAIAEILGGFSNYLETHLSSPSSSTLRALPS